MSQLEKAVPSLKFQGTFVNDQARTSEEPTHGAQGMNCQPEFRQWTSGVTRNPSPDFCFNCGDTGHIRANCNKTEDLRLVNGRLIRFIMGNEKKGHTIGSNRPSHQVSLNYDTTEGMYIPAWLVGPKTTMECIVDNEHVTSLWDSGLQVTLLFGRAIQETE